MKVKVEVLEEDIEKGERGDPFSCPIALALNRTFPTYIFSVGKNSILQEAEDRTVNSTRLLGTTGKQYRFVRRFDKGKPVTPFEFNYDPEPKHEFGFGKPWTIERMREHAEKR